MAPPTRAGPPGSSPLTRGKRGAPAHHVGGPRLIPAHAGKTVPCPRSDAGRRAHPRSRGENLQRLVIISMQAGSSPLTRGKLALALGCAHDSGLIPAHAGKTRTRPEWRWQSGAHPRSRGENRARGQAIHRRGGSSPLTRGKRRPFRPRRLWRGLIPAHAGKTCHCGDGDWTGRAHPRSRGENAVSRVVAFFEKGSSPLTRGKLSRRR